MRGGLLRQGAGALGSSSALGTPGCCRSRNALRLFCVAEPGRNHLLTSCFLSCAQAGTLHTGILAELRHRLSDASVQLRLCGSSMPNLGDLWVGGGSCGEPDLSRLLSGALRNNRCCVYRLFALQQVCQGRLSAKSDAFLHLHAATMSPATALYKSKKLFCQDMQQPYSVCGVSWTANPSTYLR